MTDLFLVYFRGVLSVSWCQADPELLLSSAKDNRILCWNPSVGEVCNLLCVLLLLHYFVLCALLCVCPSLYPCGVPM